LALSAETELAIPGFFGCKRPARMLLTKFAPPQSTAFEFPHQLFDLLAASPLPNANLSDFRHADSTSKTRPAR
jgi:hypothetical protein